eukprot:jgi/Picsp_1/3234/NSC_06074-R1_---NA---
MKHSSVLQKVSTARRRMGRMEVALAAAVQGPGSGQGDHAPDHTVDGWVGRKGRPQAHGEVRDIEAQHLFFKFKQQLTRRRTVPEGVCNSRTAMPWLQSQLLAETAVVLLVQAVGGEHGIVGRKPEGHFPAVWEREAPQAAVGLHEGLRGQGDGLRDDLRDEGKHLVLPGL